MPDPWFRHSKAWDRLLQSPPVSQKYPFQEVAYQRLTENAPYCNPGPSVAVGPAPSSLSLSFPNCCWGLWRKRVESYPDCHEGCFEDTSKGVLLSDWVLERVALSFIRGSSRPRDWTHISHVSCIRRRDLYHERHLGRPWLRKWKSEVTQSCPTLCDPIDCSLPGSSVYGIFQALVLEWTATSFSMTEKSTH